MESIPDWLESGALKNVDQIGIELHLYKDKNEGRNRLQKLLNIGWGRPIFLDLMQKLYREGFRLISWRLNIGAGIKDFRYLVVEVVLKRNNAGICPGYDV